MAASVEFYFDVGSPASYLAWTQLPRLCREFGVELVYKPMLLGGVFKATENRSPAMIPVKGRYVVMDYGRFALRYGVPFSDNPHFPIVTLTLMRAATGVLARRPDRFDAFLRVIFEALWIHPGNLNDPDETARALIKGGFDPAEIMTMTADPAVKDRLREVTDEAVARGVFGAPTTFVGDQMFFGQDRMDFIREALAEQTTGR